jgi:hypothetical protein
MIETINQRVFSITVTVRLKERRRLLKNTVLKCTRILLMMFIALSFAFTHIIKTQGNSFDPIKETKKLYSENRRDDALVLSTGSGGYDVRCG